MSHDDDGKFEYEDIINLPHFHEPGKPYMPMRDRAAQFAPFKSLTGYDDMIKSETEKLLGQDKV